MKGYNCNLCHENELVEIVTRGRTHREGRKQIGVSNSCGAEQNMQEEMRNWSGRTRKAFTAPK